MILDGLFFISAIAIGLAAVISAVLWVIALVVRISNSEQEEK